MTEWQKSAGEMDIEDAMPPGCTLLRFGSIAGGKWDYVLQVEADGPLHRYDYLDTPVLDWWCTVADALAGLRQLRKREPDLWIPTFVARNWYEITGRGTLAGVELDREDDGSFSHLSGQTVRIDGKLYRCTGVERYLHTPPFRKGEAVSLMVKPIENPVDGEGEPLCTCTHDQQCPMHAQQREVQPSHATGTRSREEIREAVRKAGR